MKKKWEMKKLVEICRFINGRAYNKQELLNKGKYPVLRVGNFFTNTHWYYSDLELDKDKYCDNGDLLYAWSASFGPKVWDGGKVIYHYHIWKVIPDYSLVTKEFLYLLLDWDKDKIKLDQGTGTTMTHVSKGSMENRLVQIPPLAEQQRIVAVLDKAFAAIATAKEYAERNLQNSKELFQSYLHNVFANKGEGWEEKKLGKLCEINPRRSVINRSDIMPTTFVPMSAVDEVNGIIAHPAQRPYSDVKKGYTFFIENDVIFAKITPCMQNGKQAIARNLIDGIGFGSTEFHVIRPNEKIMAEWIWYFVRQSVILQTATKFFKGTVGQQRVPDSYLKILNIPLPPLVEQQRIVAKLEALSEQTKNLESIYRLKIADLEELKKSILQKAFNGEL